MNKYLNQDDFMKCDNNGFIDITFKSVEEIIKVVERIMVHRYWLKYYDLIEEDCNTETLNSISFDKKIESLRVRGYTSILDDIKDEDRIVGICRDFVMLSVSLCRLNNIPSRARVGFATYLEPYKYIDHWILEVYQNNEWTMIDPQLDKIHQDILNFDFDRMNIPNDKFIKAADAWLLVREGTLDPNQYGILRWWGMDYLKINLLLEANTLMNKTLYPWNVYGGLSSKRISDFSIYDYKICDTLASLIQNIDNDSKKFELFMIEHKLLAPDIKDIKTIQL